MEARSPSWSRMEMAQLMELSTANLAGFVHGGAIMRLVDTAAGLAAIRHSGRRVVTAQVDSLTFLAPVQIGDLVRLSAVVNQVWNTSLEVQVTVTRENPMSGDHDLTTTAYVTMVAVDDAGRPVPVRPLLVETEEERTRQQQAEVRRRHRIRIREEVEQAAGPT